MPIRSRRSESALSLLGMVLMAAAIAVGMNAIATIRSEIATGNAALDELNSAIESLAREIEHIRNGPLEELIHPRAIAIVRPGLKDAQDRQLFNYIVWLDMPQVRKSDVRAVTYVFGDASFLRNRHSSTESSNGFAVGYLGWGAMTRVPITVAPAEGAEFTIAFQMFDELKLVSE